MIGIYAIKNKTNQFHYIGLSTNIEQRFLFHKRRLKSGKHKNLHLQSSWDKTGEDEFEFIILEECIEENLSEKEKFYIKHYNSADRKFGYNKTWGGEFGRLSDEIIKSTADKLRGRTLSQEMKDKISKTLTGRKADPKTVEKRAQSCTKYDDEFKKEICDYYLSNNISRKKLAILFNINFNTLNALLSDAKCKKN